MSEWSVRRKVVAVLAIPVVLAAVFGGMRVHTELQDASAYSINQQRASVLGPAIDFLTATERLALPASLADQLGTTPAKTQWTQSADILKRAKGGAGLDATQNAAVDKILQIGTTLETGSGTGITATAPVQLNDMTRLTNQLITSTLNTQGTPDPMVQSLVQALDGRLSLVKQQLLIQSNAQQSSLLGSVWLAAEIGVEGTALDNLTTALGGRRVGVLNSDNKTRLGLATSNKITDLTARPRLFAVYDGLTDRLLTSIDTTLSRSAAQTKSRALTDSAIILTALLASLLLALFVARALIVPLRKVRAGALEVANQRLPETVARIRSGKAPEEFTPIPVTSHEELGQLARAVDDMHRQALNLATGEAQLRTQVGAMFVTLSRRNTTLVNQQLALIESLEQDEEDPHRLEQLFSLDHLATRMRRTAESLVILGGADGRTAGFEELSVSDVIHAAVSEVQDYQRVRIDVVPDRMIAGRAASDVVHLMAELIDNALSYSPPGSPVTIQAAEDGGKVEIEVIDNGLGMAGEALAQTNEALKSGAEVTVDTARRMGLFVVSRLAEEHGLRVKLRRNTNGGGIVATVTLPAGVLVSGEPVEHVSVLDAPAEEEPETPVAVDEPDEEYDPYLERIEEAIAAVTGLPRRRPGQTPGPSQPAAPAASVGMFDAGPAPELPPGFEPVELPSLFERPAEDVPVGADLFEVLPETVESLETDESEETDETDFGLAPVVTADFGGDRSAVAEELVAVDDAAEEVAEEELVEPEELTAESESAADDLDYDEDEDEDDVAVAEYDEPVTDEDDVAVAEYDEPVTDEDDEPVTDQDDEPDEQDEYDEQDDTVVVGIPWLNPPAWGGTVAAEAAADVEPAEPWAPAYDAPEPVVAQAEPVDEAPVRLQIRRPLTASPAASVLEGDFVADVQEQGDSPIFGQLQSNWLSDDDEAQSWAANEVERGWSAAERAESSEADGMTRTGLPVRRPGGRLLPGGVGQEPGKVVRDPEAIRNRLAAHAAGVSRGRAAAAAQPAAQPLTPAITDDYAHEETGPA